MTYEILKNDELRAEVEETHDEVATEHGRENVFVTAIGDEIVTIVGEGVGTVDPIEITIGEDSNESQ